MNSEKREISTTELTLQVSQKAKERDYWREKLRGELEPGFFPYHFDFQADANNRPAGSHTGHLLFRLDEALCGAVMKIVKGSDIKLHMVMVAALTLLLRKYNSHTRGDFIVGTPIYKTSAYASGNLLNSILPLRNHIESGSSFKQTLLQVRETILEAVDHQNYPIEALVSKLDIAPSMSGAFPLFDIAVLLENIHDGIYLAHIPLNLVFSFVRLEEQIEVNVAYNSRLYHHNGITGILKHLTRLLTAALEDVDLPLHQLEMLWPEERERLLHDFNRTGAAMHGDKTIDGLFSDQVQKNPDFTAVTGPGIQSPHQYTLTYRELNEKSQHLALLLKEAGVGRESIVPLMVERSIEMIIGIIGILQAGAAYLPIDPGYPAARIDFMIADCAARLLVTGSTMNSVAAVPLESFYLNSLPDIEPGHRPDSQLGDRPAYVIYTSGTTGKPKGSLTTHTNVTRVVFQPNYIDITPADRVLQLSNYAFDGSVFDIYGALVNGAPLVLVGKESFSSMHQLAQQIKDAAITVFFITTALFNKLVDTEFEKLKYVRKILFGGERVSFDHSRRALEYLGRDRLIHVYGPTETAVFATIYPIDEIPDNAITIPIGKPISATSIFILDSDEAPVPVGVPGEIFIGGDGVARGYLNQPELTAERFSRGTEPSGQPDKLYRTGDLAKWREDGNIEFIGRIDHQVKIRGFRVELPEIENRLLQHDSIKEAVVIMGEDKTGDNYLGAYFSLHPSNNGGGGIESSVIRDYLSQRLPDYMVPSYFMQLEKMPLNTSGKINRQVLPKFQLQLDSGNIVPPENDIERKLMEIWSELLDADEEKMGIHNSFFELGGHSLKGTSMIAKIHRAFEIKLTLGELFSNPTVKQLAALIEGSHKSKFVQIEAVEKKEYYPLSSAQKRLYIFQQLQPGSNAYNVPAVYRLAGNLDIDKFQAVFHQLIRRHDVFRSSFTTIAGEMVQIIAESVDFEAFYLELSEAEAEEKIPQLLRPFDLSHAPLLRATVIKVGEQRYIIVFDMHHIISDGYSMDVLMADFIDLYQGKSLAPLKIQYKDYAVRQNEQLEGEAFKKREEYWLNHLDGFVFTRLPMDYPERGERATGGTLSRDIDADLYRRLDAFCNKHNVTKFTFMITVFAMTLARTMDQWDITLGIPSSIRDHPDLKNLIGIFLNVVLIRSVINYEDSFLIHLAYNKEVVHSALNNQDYPYERLNEKMAGAGQGQTKNTQTKNNEMFSILFNYFPMDNQRETAIPGIKIESPETQDISPKTDITIYIPDDGEESVTITVVYKSNLYLEETMDNLLTDFLETCCLVLEDGNRSISQLTTWERDSGGDDRDDGDDLDMYYNEGEF